MRTFGKVRMMKNVGRTKCGRSMISSALGASRLGIIEASFFGIGRGFWDFGEIFDDFRAFLAVWKAKGEVFGDTKNLEFGF